MRIEEARARVVRYAVFLAVAGVAWWGLTRGLPRWRELAAIRGHRARIEATTLDARSRTVRSGDRAMEDSISAARSRFAATQALVPGVGTGEGDGDVRRLLAALAENSGVAVRALEEGPGGREGALLVSSARVTAAGRYHDLGAWVSMVEATRRLVQVKDVTMSAAAEPLGGSGANPGSASRGTETVILQATVRWFRRDSSGVGQDSTKGRQ